MPGVVTHTPGMARRYHRCGCARRHPWQTRRAWPGATIGVR